MQIQTSSSLFIWRKLHQLTGGRSILFKSPQITRWPTSRILVWGTAITYLTWSGLHSQCNIPLSLMHRNLRGSVVDTWRGWGGVFARLFYFYFTREMESFIFFHLRIRGISNPLWPFIYFTHFSITNIYLKKTSDKQCLLCHMARKSYKVSFGTFPAVLGWHWKVKSRSPKSSWALYSREYSARNAWIGQLLVERQSCHVGLTR